MDIWLIGTEEGTLVHPMSVHGMLWLQTHFENQHWEALASNQVLLPIADMQNFSKDVAEAGLNLAYMTTLAVTR